MFAKVRISSPKKTSSSSPTDNIRWDQLSVRILLLPARHYQCFLSGCTRLRLSLCPERNREIIFLFFLNRNSGEAKTALLTTHHTSLQCARIEELTSEFVFRLMDFGRGKGRNWLVCVVRECLRFAQLLGVIYSRRIFGL